MEVWKPIEGTDGKYEVSNTGKVRSVGTHVNKGIRELIQKTDRYGYRIVTIYYDEKRKSRTVHRLVASAFIPNPEALPQINHIDGNKENNNSSNLEWCSASHNIKHAFDMGLKEKSREHAAEVWRTNNEKRSKPVLVIDESGNVMEFPSISEASRKLNISRANAQQVLNGNGRRKTAGGYSFKFK